MRHALVLAISVLGISTLGVATTSLPAHAISCADGVYRAGCVGPNGAAVVHKPAPVYHKPATVTCAKGVYREGCAGSNGAVVRRY